MLPGRRGGLLPVPRHAAATVGLELAICAAGDEVRDACKICGTDSAPGEENAGGDRIVTIKALIYQDDE